MMHRLTNPKNAFFVAFNVIRGTHKFDFMLFINEYLTNRNQQIMIRNLMFFTGFSTQCQEQSFNPEQRSLLPIPIY